MASSAALAAPAAGPMKDGKQGPPILPNPFVRAARKHDEPTLDTTSAALAAASMSFANNDVAAYGFLRGIWLLVTAAGGTGGSAAAAGDAPWNVLQDITLKDVNGNPMTGPIDGYKLYLINKYGGYKWATNPTSDPNYSAMDANGNFQFALYVPVEISAQDGYGALPNMNAGQPFKLDFTVAASTTVYTTPPATTLPTVRVRAYIDAWTQPEAIDMRGVPNEQLPPSNGTVQYWSNAVLPMVSGENRPIFPRVGNLIRNIGLVFYNDSTPSVRAAEFPTTLQLFVDGVLLRSTSKAKLDSTIYQDYGFSPDTGVIWFTFCDDLDGHPGYELRNSYLPTNGATKLQLVGSFAGAGSLHILTNDVAPASGDIYG